MDIYDKINRILDEEPNQDAQILALTLINNRFVEDPQRYDEEEYLQILRDFLACAREQFAVSSKDYLRERMAVETVFQTVMQAHRLPEELIPEATREAVTSYFEGWIEQSISQFQQETGKEELPVSENDISVIDMADIFAHVWPTPEDVAFCEEIGVRYHHEQLHMVCWFSSQLTKGSGSYSRNSANLSARATYNRLMDADSLLWICTVLGMERDVVRKAAEAAGAPGKQRATGAACSRVRQVIPFDMLLPKAVELQTRLVEQYSAGTQ